MDILSKLTPAETLVLLKPNEITRNEMLRYTLMDLILRRVVDVHKIERPPRKGHHPLDDYYFTKGIKFGKEKPAYHELVFLYPFFEKTRDKFLFRHLLQIGFEKAEGNWEYKQQIILYSQELPALIQSSTWNRIMGTIKLNLKGKKIRDEVIRYFNLLDKTLPAIVEQDQPEAVEIMKTIKGNIMLLKSFKFKMVSIIGRELAVMERKENEGEE